MKFEDLVIPNLGFPQGPAEYNVQIVFGNNIEKQSCVSFGFTASETVSLLKLSNPIKQASKSTVKDLESTYSSELELSLEENYDATSVIDGTRFLKFRLLFTAADSGRTDIGILPDPRILAECSCLVEVKSLRERSVLDECLRGYHLSDVGRTELLRCSRSELRVCPLQNQSKDVNSNLTVSFEISVNGVRNLRQLGPSKLLYKMRDDVRQDEIISDMIFEMNRALKSSGLDLCLLCYSVYSLGYQDGIIEWVDSSVQLSSILDKYKTSKNPILAFLREHNDDMEQPNGVNKTAFDCYLRSCAGYSIITYLLAIGDRHLDNLMLHKSGRFFHIDYGFIFGLDPKPFKCLLRVTKEMITAMGGESSPGYMQFLRFSSDAFLILRRHSSVVLNMIRAMSEAGLSSLGINQSADAALFTVHERYRLDLDDKAAEQYILSVITDASQAVLPVVMEEMHKLAVSFR